MLQVDEAQACLKQAQEYWQSKQWQETIQACAQALALNQQLPMAHKLMGDALQKTNKIKEAIGYYREAVSLQPDFAEVYANLGSLYAKQQEYQLATNCYRQALAIDPNFTAVQGFLERVKRLQQQDRSETVKVTTESNPTFDNHLEQGDSLQGQGELEAALNQYLKAAKLRPQRVETYRKIAKLCEKLGRWADAAKYYRLILRLTSGHSTDESSGSTILESIPTEVAKSTTNHFNHSIKPRNVPQTIAKREPSPIDLQQTVSDSTDYLERGKNLASQGNYEAAISNYRQAIKQDPKLIAAYLAISELLIQLGQADAAISCYLSGLKQEHHPELYFGLGNVYQTKQQRSRAILCYQKAVQYDRNYGRAYHELGEVLSQQQEWSEAVKAYRQAIALQPDFSWSYNNLGYALIQLHQWSDAIPVYQQAIELQPDFIWSYYNLAEAYGKLGQWSDAIPVYQQAIELQPDLPQVQQRLGDAFYRRSQQDRQQALDCFVLAIKQDPYNTEAYHQALAIDNRNIALYLKLGDILAESGKTDRAIVVYQMALQVQPRNSEVLARIYQHQDSSLALSPAESGGV